MNPGRIVRPAGYSDDESDYEGLDDFDYYCNYPSSGESGYDEPVTTASSAIVMNVSESLQDAMSKCLLSKIEELIPQIENYSTFQLRNNMKPLQFAALLGKPELIEYFLKYDVDCGVCNLDVNPAPLTLACSVLNENVDEDHLKCAEILLKAGADVNSKDVYSVNALMTACKNSTLDVVKLLLLSGAEVNDCDNDGWSPIFYAANRGEKDIVQELLNYNARFNQMDKRNRYPHTLAFHKAFTDIADLLKPEVVVRNEEASVSTITVSGTTKLTEYVNENEPSYSDDVIGMLFGVSVDMERYAPLFRDKKINLYEFLLLKKEEDLKKIGIPLSWHRQAILGRIREFHLSHWQPSSLGLCERTKDGTQEPRYMMHILSYMASLRQHMLVLKASLEYLRCDLIGFSSNNPDVIDSMQNMQSISKAIIERVKQLQDQVQIVKKMNLSRLRAQHV